MPIVIPYTKQTWTDGSGGGTPLSAARMGVLEEGILDTSQAPAVRVFHNASQNTTSGVSLALAFNSERFDQAGGASSTMHDTVTNNSRLICRYAGIYYIAGNWNMAANASGQRQIQIRLNGATNIATSLILPSGTYGTITTISTVYSLAVNDYVELIAFQDSGSTLAITSAGNYSPEFSMVRVA